MNFKCRRHLVWKKTEKLGKKLGKRLYCLRESSRKGASLLNAREKREIQAATVRGGRAGDKTWKKNQGKKTWKGTGWRHRQRLEPARLLEARGQAGQQAGKKTGLMEHPQVTIPLSRQPLTAWQGQPRYVRERALQ